MKWLWLVLAAGCIGTTPDDRERDALGGENPLSPDTGPEHRPGQPCLVCHDGDFELAGTVFDRVGDPLGTEGVEVEVTDAAGHVFVALTNRVGNFYVEQDDELRTHSDGEVSIPWEIAFPISVLVRRDGLDEQMRSRVYRERSCAGCHASVEAFDSPGPVYLEDEP